MTPTRGFAAMCLSVVERYEYDAYGKPHALDPATYAERPISNSLSRYLFTGRELDILDYGSLKIQYNRNRYYDSYTGRWTTQDPLGITLNQWTFVAATYNGSKLRLYINDTMQEFSEARPLGSSVTTNVYLGTVYGSGRYFNGLIDDAMIFNKALSQDEVGTLYDSFTLDWDENGNLINNNAGSPSAVAYSYNWDNKLRKAQWTANDSIELKYDPHGNRVYKKSGSTERKYIVDIVGELPVILMEIEPASGNIMKIYIYGNSEVLAQHNGPHTATKCFYLHDRLGSVRQIINTSGLVQKHDLGIVHERNCNSEALLQSAGEVLELFFAFILEVREFYQPVDIGVPAIEKPRVVLDGLPDRYPVERAEPLWENADAADDFVLLFCDIHIEKAHLSRRWRADCLDYLNGSGLAGAVWTQESEHFAFPDGERYVVDCQYIPVTFRQFLDVDYVFSFFCHGSAFHLH